MELGENLFKKNKNQGRSCTKNSWTTLVFCLRGQLKNFECGGSMKYGPISVAMLVSIVGKKEMVNIAQ